MTGLVFSARTRWAVSTGAVISGVAMVVASAFVADAKEPFIMAHALTAVPYTGAATLLCARVRRVTEGRYRHFWACWLGGNLTSLGASVSAAVAVAADLPALLLADVVLMIAGVPLWTSAAVELARANVGRRSLSVDLVDVLSAIAVLGAPALLLVAEPLANSGQLLFGVPFALALVLAPVALYLSFLNLSRAPPGERAAMGFGAGLGIVFTVSVTLQLAHVLGDLHLPVAVFVGLHVVVMMLLVAVPLWAHVKPRARLAELPPEHQVRLNNPMPVVSAVALPLLGCFVFATRHDRPWGVPFLVVILLVVVALNATRYVVLSRETRRLHAGLAEMAEERRRLVASMLRALEDDRRRTATELHSQAVGSLITLGTLAQTAFAGLPSDSAAAVKETVGRLQADLGGRAEELRQLMVAMKAPAFAPRATCTAHRAEPDGAPPEPDGASPGGGGTPVEGRAGDDALAAALRASASELLRDETTPRVTVGVDARLRMDWSTMTVAYRIAQEALLNAVRHAGARTVAVRVVGQDGGVLVEVADDGCGFEPDEVAGGSGLATMELFSRLGHGELDVQSRPGGPTVVRSLLGLARAPGTAGQGPPTPPERPGRRPERPRGHLRLVAGRGSPG